MDPAVLREDMVDSLQHETKGCLDSPELSLAMREVPRHHFVEGRGAYEDVSHRYGDSTILAPSLVAMLLEALAPEPDDDVLVVGAGVGYTAAVIAELGDSRRVHAVDIDRELVIHARRNLAKAGYREVLVDRRDGARGLPEYAPYDRILVEASVIEPPPALLTQLATGGRLVVPLGTAPQSIGVFENGRLVERGESVRFKPLLVEGEQGSAVERNRMLREDTERAHLAIESQSGWEHDWIEW